MRLEKCKRPFFISIIRKSLFHEGKRRRRRKKKVSFIQNNKREEIERKHN